MSTETNPHESNAPGYEVRDISVRPIALWGGILLAVVIGSYFLVASLNRNMRTEPEELSPLFTRPEPVEPRLLAKPRDELVQHRAYEQAIIEGYRWVERDRVARVPVRRGMEILIERGLPVRKPAGAPRGGGM